MAYDDTTTNEQIYLDVVRPMIEAAFNKTKVTCFAYGQTGSGKTFTMMGPGTNSLEMGTPGLYLLSAFDIFSYLEYEYYNHLEIWVSFYEIYCGKLFDLLNDRALLTAREDGKQNICIVGLTEKQVSNLTSMMQLIDYGLKVRTVGITGANSDSSRSHGIIQISIKEPNGNPHGKISFIDLAGSERAADTIDTNKQTKIDGAEINKSLLALKECIRALDQDKKYTPFRGSKLTLVLRDSFMGNCKTLMIANVSPCLTCSEHTLNTLRYADRVKELRGRDNKDVKTNDNINCENATKDPQEVLANLLMMPRQHGIIFILILGKTIKYNVDKNNNPIRSSFSGPSITNTTNYNSNNPNMNQSKITNNLNNNVQSLVNRKVVSNSNVNNININFNQNQNQIQIGSNQTSNAKSNNSVNNYNQTLNKENTNNNIENQLFNLLNNKTAKTKNTNEVSAGNKITNSNPNNLINTALNNNINRFPPQITQVNTQIQQNNQSNTLAYPPQANQQGNSNANNFLANYNSFTNKQRNSLTSQASHLSKSPSNNEFSEEELQKLSERHEKLINKILIEEESYIENHRKHIDEIVEIVKEVTIHINKFT